MILDSSDEVGAGVQFEPLARCPVQLGKKLVISILVVRGAASSLLSGE